MLVGCGQSRSAQTMEDPVTVEYETAQKEETIAEETTAEETTETAKIEARELDIVYVELNNKEFLVNEDVKEYILSSDETVYSSFVVTHDVDITKCGEYQIKVTGVDHEFTFPVVVRDTVFPAMEIVADFMLTRHGEEISADLLITKAEDNDPELRVGFIGFEKVMELSELDYDYMETTSPVYEQEHIDDTTGLIEVFTFPKEEGVYESKAVVIDTSGNAGIATMYFVVDNTGPTISIAKTHVKLKAGEGYDFGTGLDCKDNFFPREECAVWVDEHSFNALDYFLGSGLGGETTLKYMACDAVGNMTEKVIKVTAESALAGNGGGNGGSSGSSGNSGDSSSQSQNEGFFDEGLARDAFDKVNEYRVQNGLSALAWNDTLYEAAKIRAKEFSVVISHTRPDGSGFETVFEEVGLSTNRGRGENAAYGDTTGVDVAAGWYNSAGHKENMLRDIFDCMAVACYRVNGNFFWINLFLG